MSWHIYMLTDPRDGRVRYVGKTVRLKQRLCSHVCEAIHKVGRNHRVNWLRSVLESGAMPVLSVLESGDGDWMAAEKRWIKHFRDAGADLVNSTDGGDGAHDPTPEVRAKIGAAGKLRRDTPETKAKKSAASKALWTPEYRARASAVRKELWQNPEYRDKLLAKRKEAGAAPEVCAKKSEASKALWQNPEYREKMLEKRREQGARPEFRAKMAVINKGHWDSPGYRDKHQQAMANFRAARKKESVA